MLAKFFYSYQLLSMVENQNVCVLSIDLTVYGMYLNTNPISKMTILSI